MEGRVLFGDSHQYQSKRLQETVNSRDPDFALVGIPVGRLNWLHYGMQMCI